MSEATQGSTVRVNYTGKLDDGTVFDSTSEREPLEFTLGEGRIIPGFEAAVEGMSEGETKSAVIPSEQAYGEHQEEMVEAVPRNMLPDDIDFKEGSHFQIDREGTSMVVKVIAADDAQVTFDGNHPLAGKDLTFDIELLEVKG